MLGAVLFVADYALPVIDPGLEVGLVGFLAGAARVTWVLFAVDYGVRLWLSRDRRTFLRRHKLDLAAVALPALRPLRLLTMITVLNRNAGPLLRGKVTAIMVAAASLLILLSSIAILDAERGRQGANIETFGDALWWAMATVTTVGYGDHYPVTTEGRLVAVVLMLTGISVIGVVSATFGSWLTERAHQLQHQGRPPEPPEIHALHAEIDRLRAELRSVRSGAASLTDEPRPEPAP